ncbi:ABC transporter ATP-binding protein [Marmoricola endophyticus]|uniref:ABC transporter ATP-binding protein n=1 Tax=Marmoricola endophyticus TaxID=2040280 RepID=A0A917BTM0_9ACTN|nr:ABC transporter ATP-binding protein [Marmoricola endophyticus]GGF58399.1 ABC transporter ATP-binding protein [Marmoricola endophyticus]
MMTTEPHHAAGPTTDAAVRLDGVRKSFGRVEAVRGIDLTLRPGEVVAFLGPNGAGKTTTIDMILGLSRPTSGTVTTFGMTPRAAIARGLVAAVMQTGGLLKDLTVRETVAYTALLFADTKPVDEVLDSAGITDIADRKVGKCSGGEQQRLRFAMALLSDPALLLLDEPTTGMDVEGRRSFWSSIRADASQGRTVLFATHYLEEADQYADRIVLVAGGRVVADGSGAEIRGLASGRTVRARLASPDTTAHIEAIRSLGGVDGVDVRGEQLYVHTKDSDAVARYLLTRTDARDLEIESKGLEEAFLSLTGDPHHDEQHLSEGDRR